MLRAATPPVYRELEKIFCVFLYATYHVMLLIQISKIFNALKSCQIQRREFNYLIWITGFFRVADPPSFSQSLKVTQTTLYAINPGLYSVSAAIQYRSIKAQ